MAASAESAYMFSHALLQRACYELMLPSERGQLHRYALEFLETNNLAPSEELAAHALAGQVGAPAEISTHLKSLRLKFLREAANLALDQYANERGLALLDTLLQSEGLDKREQVQTICRRAELLYRSGRLDKALPEAERAHALAQALGDDLELARAQLTLGRCCVDSAENARALGLLALASETLRRQGHRDLLQRALTHLSTATWLAGHPADAIAPAQEAAAMADALGSEPRSIGCQLNVINILSQLGRHEEAAKHASKVELKLQTSPNPESRCTIAATLGNLHHRAQRHEQARALYERASLEAAKAGMQAEIARAKVNLGGICTEQRRFNEGLDHLEYAEATARELGDRRILWYALHNRCEILERVGDFRGALHAATSALRVAKAAGLAWQSLLSSAQAASSFLELGQVEDALLVANEALQGPGTGRDMYFIHAKLQAQRACALFRQGQRALAMDSVREMERHLELAQSEPEADSQRWIQEARSLASG